MAASTLEKSLADELDVDNQDEERNKIMARIEGDFKAHGAFHVTRAQQRTIVLVGRTRVGKSTIKSMLVNPTDIANELTLNSEANHCMVELLHIAESNLILNIIDTPGILEKEADAHDSESTIKTIEMFMKREGTKLHVMCFCVSILAGIKEDDIKAFTLLLNSIGEEVSRKSCLIITHCESKNAQQREKLTTELFQDTHFKRIAPFFKLGVFFSGALSRDDYNNANTESILRQFVTISEYRKELLKMFSSNIKPFPIDATLISDIRRAHDEAKAKEKEYQNTLSGLEQKALVHQTQMEVQLQQQKDLIDMIEAQRQREVQTFTEKIRHIEEARLRAEDNLAKAQRNYERQQEEAEQRRRCAIM